MIDIFSKLTEILAVSISDAVWLGESRPRLTVINAERQVLLDTVYKDDENDDTAQIMELTKKRVKFEPEESKHLKLGKRKLRSDAENEDVSDKKKRKRQRLEQAELPSKELVVAHFQKLLQMSPNHVTILATKETINRIAEPTLKLVARKALTMGVPGCIELIEAH